MERYPFVVNRKKAVVVEALSLDNAINRVCYKFPNKFIRTTFARNVQKHLNSNNMDLINAQTEAKKLSKLNKNELVYIILEHDEFVVKLNSDVNTGKDDLYSSWKNGKKFDDLIEAQKENESETLTTNKMATAKKSPAKKAAKKSPTKKVAKKAAAKKTKKAPAKKGNFEAGKVVSISIKDMRANIKKGYVYRDPQGVIQTEKYMATRAKQDHVREGMHEYKPSK